MSPAESLVTTNAVIAEMRVKGVCKWFNNKSGYGFLTVTEGEKKDVDIFVHHSSLNVGNEDQYKYLVQGEYVDFTVSSIDKSESKHEFHATNVTGVNNGKLMCETRNEVRTRKPNAGFKVSSTFVMRKQGKQINEENLEKVVETNRDDSEKNEWTSVKSKTLGNVVRGRGRPKKNE
jgi:cold shock CspA family protein